MDPTDVMHSLRKLVVKIKKDKCLIQQTEAATKNALIEPFIEEVLGNSVSDLAQVIPEYSADVAAKKGEKVDYAIMKDGEPIMLIECKCCGEDLKGSHKNQLCRYFMTTKARLGVLTNGVEYRIFSNLETKDKTMDSEPFLEFQLSGEDQIDKFLADQILKLSRPHFDVEEIIPWARRLMYENELYKHLSAQAQSPSKDFVKFLCKIVYDGRVTDAKIKEFTPIVRRVLDRFSSEKIGSSQKSVGKAGH